MHPAVRTRYDKKQLEYSRRGGLDCRNSKDMARQEGKADADINIMLKRFGVNQQQRTLNYGEQDFTIDLQQGLKAIEETRSVYEGMTPDIKKIYPTYEKFIAGMRSGSVAKDMERLEREAEPTKQQKEILRDIERGKIKDSLIRDQEAAEIAEQHKRGTAPKTPKSEPPN